MKYLEASVFDELDENTAVFNCNKKREINDSNEPTTSSVVHESKSYKKLKTSGDNNNNSSPNETYFIEIDQNDDDDNQIDNNWIVKIHEFTDKE